MRRSEKPRGELRVYVAQIRAKALQKCARDSAVNEELAKFQNRRLGTRFASLLTATLEREQFPGPKGVRYACAKGYLDL
jgi:hypothetical protein